LGRQPAHTPPEHDNPEQHSAVAAQAAPLPLQGPGPQVPPLVQTLGEQHSLFELQALPEPW
jgi:hypothetical protein